MNLKIFIALIILHVYSMPVTHGQTRWSALVGLSMGIHPATDGVLAYSGSVDEFYFSMSRSGRKFLAGINLKCPLQQAFYIEMGVLYAQESNWFSAAHSYVLPTHAPSLHEMKVQGINLAFPLNMGVDLGRFSVISGFSPEIMLTETSELGHMPGYWKTGNQMKLKWQIGASIRFEPIALQIQFGNYFARACRNMYIMDQSLELQNTQPQMDFLIRYMW